MNVIGDVEGRTCIILDDIIDTAGTLIKGTEALKSHGAARVFASGVHRVLSGPAVDRINASVLESVLVTNTIPIASAAARCPRLRSFSVAPLLGEAIQRIHDGASVSSLFV